MRHVLAMLPILLVLVLMMRWRLGAHKAGPAGLLLGVAIAAAAFGLTPQVIWVSQAKGVLLSVFVLLVMWPALFLFHWFGGTGGINALALALQRVVPDRGTCALLMAWALSGLLEGLAGFGLPVAIVSPMLLALGVSPIQAVAAVAVGHAWAVSFGDMGIIFQTLSAVVEMPSEALVPWSAILLGAACFGCGLSTAMILGELRLWPKVLGLSLFMGLVQYGTAAAGLIPLSGFGAGLSGLVVYVALSWLKRKGGVKVAADSGEDALGKGQENGWGQVATAYFGLAALMASLTLIPSLREAAQSWSWKASFEEVKTASGFVTPAGYGPTFRLWTHPGTLIALVAVIVVALTFFFRAADGRQVLLKAAAATWRSGAITSIGILSMVGLSTLMEHCGMTWLLAEGASQALGKLYPIVAPLVGMLGAFATGSNNNSNIMFGMLQKNVAVLLHISPALLVSAQTAGGSLGSLLAPAKLVVGCSTVGLQGQEGLVLRRTLPHGLVLGAALGLLTLVIASFFSRS